MIKAHERYYIMLEHVFDTLAHACSRGEFGNGQTRVDCLREIGLSPHQVRDVQRRVNKIMQKRKQFQTKNKLKK